MMRPLKRVLVVILVAAVSVFAAFITSRYYGKGFASAEPESIPTIGRIQHLRMPNSARALEDIRSMEIQIPEAGAHAKIFVNGYVLIDNENPRNIFVTLVGDKNSRDSVTAMAVDRRNYRVGSRPAQGYLRKGNNYIVVELENTHLGCNTEIDVAVNGIELEHFPKIIPDRLYVEAETVNNVVKDRLDRLGGWGVRDSLCSRRVWELELE